ncbi:MAG: hypothetical protein OEM93_01100 [Rhodospirillales bacterium]|nr:hypothetical protein [Rhodospirillales bacterium]MDH3792783.1 hypothetical protein [Rhodospirillales bacterium]MDH3967096.1 hypothetical protein [Rhodospirillales bacterium]
MKSFSCIVMASLAACLAATSMTWAAPPSDDCEEDAVGLKPADTSLGTCMDKIVEEQGLLLEEAAKLVTGVEEVKSLYLGRARSDTDDDLQTRIEALEKEQERAVTASLDTEDLDYDDMIEQADKEKGRNDKKCKGRWVEFEEVESDPEAFLPPGLRLKFPPGQSNLGNGNCDKFEALDRDSRDVTVRERNLNNVCLRLCDDKEEQTTTLGTRKPKKEKRKERIVGRMTDGLSTARKATARLKGENERVAALRLLATDAKFVLPDPGFPLAGELGECEAAFEFPTDLVIIASLTVAIGVAKTVTNVLDGVRDGTERACDQTAVGFNGAAACTVLEVAYHVSNGITDLIEVARDGVEVGFDIVGSQQTDAIHDCLESIKTDTETLKADTAFLKEQGAGTGDGIEELKESLALLKGLVEQNRDLLLTPQGRRDEFPLK